MLSGSDLLPGRRNEILGEIFQMLSQQDPVKLWPVMGWWIFANLGGWGVGISTGILLTLAAGAIPWVNQDRFLSIALLPSIGLACGVAQWMVLRDILPHSSKWILGTLAGYVLALLVLLVFNLAKLSNIGLWDDAVLLALMGAAIGVPQWWLLRQHYRGTGLWIFATGAGFLSFLWLVSRPANSQNSFILIATLLGGLAAVITGFLLAGIVRQPRIELS
jgi:hypothetical protein